MFCNGHAVELMKDCEISVELGFLVNMFLQKVDNHFVVVAVIQVPHYGPMYFILCSSASYLFELTNICRLNRTQGCCGRTQPLILG